MMGTLSGRRYDTGEPIHVRIADGRIVDVVPACPSGDVADWPWLAPGLFDLQVNGYAGTWFSGETLTVDATLNVLAAYRERGMTRVCPTLVTNSDAVIEHALGTIRSACEREAWANELVWGIHLEGPCLSPVDGARGAHPREWIRPPRTGDWETWQTISGGRIRLITVAPEVPGVIEWIGTLRAAAKSGSQPSPLAIAVGHTLADEEQLAAAVHAGATFSTHLGNGLPTTLHRHRNPLIAQLGQPGLAASLITDGVHLPASLVRTIIATKSPRNVVLTCDVSGWGGCSPGEYASAWGSVEILPDERIVVAGQRELLAGSGALTADCVARAVTLGSISLAAAIDMASRNPARLLGAPRPGLRPGAPADLIQFRWQPGDRTLHLVATLQTGSTAAGTVWQSR